MKTYEERTKSVLQKAKKKRRNRKIAAAATAAVLAAATALDLWLFIPFNSFGADLSEYKNSEYYPLMTKLNALTYDPPKYKNNFEKWFGGMREALGGLSFGCGGSKDGMDAPNSAGTITTPEFNPDYSSSEKYEEVTNNQTAGVIEGDLFKRSDKYAYYLDFTPSAEYWGNYAGAVGEETLDAKSASAHYRVRIYSIDGLASKEVSEFPVFAEEGTSFRSYGDRAELYLSEDCKTVAVITPCYGYDRNTNKQNVYTMVATIDVSDPEKPKETGRKYLSGSYISSRVKDGKMLIFSDFSVRKSPDFSDETQYLPQEGEWGNLQSLPVENILCPENASSAKYTVVCKLDLSSFETEDCMALLSFSDNVYVSEENIFVTRFAVAEYRQEEFDFYCSYETTEISCISYAGDGLEYVNSVCVTGRVDNQYQLDEYEGVLRVATTYRRRTLTYVVAKGEKMDAALLRKYDADNANLYCISLDTFEIVGKAERFAPEGESVKSARFDGETAYVCTAKTILWKFTDPVYAFNVSDPKNITSKDTGTIDGYSVSMIKFTDDTLLGIGYGEMRDTFKAEIYAVGEDDVQSVAKFEKDCEFSEQFKSYFIDKERGLIGLGINDYEAEPYEASYGSYHRYLVLRFDGYTLTELYNVRLSGDNAAKRAFYKDGYLYLFGNNDFKVLAMD